MVVSTVPASGPSRAVRLPNLSKVELVVAESNPSPDARVSLTAKRLFAVPAVCGPNETVVLLSAAVPTQLAGLALVALKQLETPVLRDVGTPEATIDPAEFLI